MKYGVNNIYCIVEQNEGVRVLKIWTSKITSPPIYAWIGCHSYKMGRKVPVYKPKGLYKSPSGRNSDMLPWWALKKGETRSIALLFICLVTTFDFASYELLDALRGLQAWHAIVMRSSTIWIPQFCPFPICDRVRSEVPSFLSIHFYLTA